MQEIQIVIEKEDYENISKQKADRVAKDPIVSTISPQPFNRVLHMQNCYSLSH